MYSRMVWSEGALAALKSHKFFGSHYGHTNSWVAPRSDRRNMVWSEGLGSHDGLIRGQSLGKGPIGAA